MAFDPEVLKVHWPQLPQDFNDHVDRVGVPVVSTSDAPVGQCPGAFRANLREGIVAAHALANRVFGCAGNSRDLTRRTRLSLSSQPQVGDVATGTARSYPAESVLSESAVRMGE